MMKIVYMFKIKSVLEMAFWINITTQITLGDVERLRRLKYGYVFTLSLNAFEIKQY